MVIHSSRDFQVVVIKMEGAALMRRSLQVVKHASLSKFEKASLHQFEKPMSLETWTVCHSWYPEVFRKL